MSMIPLPGLQKALPFAMNAATVAAAYAGQPLLCAALAGGAAVTTLAAPRFSSHGPRPWSGRIDPLSAHGYQPIMDIRTGALVSIEAVFDGPLKPGQLVSALEKLVSDARDWPTIGVALPLESRVLSYSNLVERIVTAAQDCRNIHLTANLPAAALSRHPAAVDRLRDAGVIISIYAGRGVRAALKSGRVDLLSLGRGLKPNRLRRLIAMARAAGVATTMHGVDGPATERAIIIAGIDRVSGPNYVGTMEAAKVAAMLPFTPLADMAVMQRKPAPTAGTFLPLAERRLMGELRAAYGKGEVALHYQPKMKCRSNEIDSIEGLIRWQHPTRGAIMPGDFIRTAEDSGDIIALTHWTLERAIGDQRALAAKGVILDMSINLSAGLVSNRRFLSDAIRRCEGRAGRLTMEITETAIIDDPDAALAGLDMLKEAGIDLSIDDYGAGMSSLTYLKRVPASELKIDRLFAAELTRSHNDPMLMRSSIDLAHGLGMEVTAEGIEAPAALALLRVMGCDRVQGYLTGRPMPLERLRTFLAQHEHLNAIEAPAIGFRPAANFW
ncbi:MAG: EAL domain-containing protein [Pacificimonas sp.]